MGKAEENKRKKRTALLSQAFSLFMNKGITNTTISEIVEHADVAKGTFYIYFKDKDDLIEKLIAQKAEQLLINALDILNKHPKTTKVEDKLVLIADSLLEQLNSDSRLLKFINKNLNYGIYKKALLSEEIKTEFDVMAAYYKILHSDGSEWKDPILMLYTIVELVSSTCHSIILEEDPVDLEYYKPYLFGCIRSIVDVFRVKQREVMVWKERGDSMFQRKTPFEAEWEKLQKKEQKFLKEREEQKVSYLNQKLADKIPPKLQGTLDKAFAKVFGLIFEKGTDVI